MAQTFTVTCDGPGCKAVKQSTNHWWMMWIVKNEKGHAVTVTTWELGEVAAEHCLPDLHLCSQACAVKAIDKWMSEVKQSTEATPKKSTVQ